MMKYIFIIMVALSLGACETNYGTINTGLANGEFDGNMYEYFQANHYDWDTLVLMIDKAGLKDVFTGEREGYEKITFFGPTDNTIRSWMYEKKTRTEVSYIELPDGTRIPINKQVEVKPPYYTVDEIPEDSCRRLIMEHVVKGVYMLKDFPVGTLNNSGEQEGGITLEGGNGNWFWIYSYNENYQGIAGQGAARLNIISAVGQEVGVASSNIASDNGVVHSLNYDYPLGTL